MNNSDYSDIKKLGWLSSYTRQVLLTRFLVRSLSDLLDTPVPIDGHSLLYLFRIIISLPAKPEDAQKYCLSAPYQPPDKPHEFTLKLRRHTHPTFSVSIFDVNYLNIALSNAKGDSFGGEYETPGDYWINQFFDEIVECHAGTNLSKKYIADERALKIAERPIWAYPKEKSYSYTIEELRHMNGLDDGAWEYWIKLYQGFQQNRAPDWALWRAISLIDESIWKQGPKAVAREIELLQAAGDLDTQIERFEAHLLRLASQPIFEGNSHNGGPPLNELQTRKETIDLIRVQLDILKAERDKVSGASTEEPDPEVISSAIEKIVAFVKRHLVACIVSGAVATGALNKVGADMIEHYNVSESIFQSVDDLTESAARFIEKLRARPTPSKPSQPKSSPVDL